MLRPTPRHQQYQQSLLFKEFHQILEKAYNEVWNDAIRLSKSMEPLLGGVSLQLFIRTPMTMTFYKKVLEGLSGKCPALQPYAEQIMNIS